MIGSAIRSGALLAGCLAACLVLTNDVAEAKEIAVDESRVVRAVVYPDRAQVTRRARVDVPAGAHELVVSSLPIQLDTDSLRVSASGVPAAIGAVQLTLEAREPAKTPELIAAEQEVERLERELSGVASERAVDARLRKFLESIQATTAVRTSEDLGEGDANPNAIGAVYELLSARFDELARGDLERNVREKELREKLQVARAQLDAVRPQGPLRFRVASIGIEAERAGSLTIELEYVVGGASWRPAYRASLDAERGEIDWIAEGVVRQSTSEDWSGIELALSTAAPARGVEPPRLPPWFLRPYEPPRRLEKMSAARGGSVDEVRAAEAPAPSAEFDAQLEMQEGFADAAKPTAAIVTTAYNVSFDVPGAADVPSDGREHRVLLREDTLDAELGYRTVPQVNEAAYVVASSKAPADYPLLSGPVRVFVEGAFLGTYAISETGAGEEVDVPFGQDSRVRVERVRLPQERTREGFAGRDREVTYAWRTTIENLRGSEIDLVVEDRVPKSEDERIEVRIEKQTTEGWKGDPDRPGILLWDRKIAPKGKAEIVLVYSVRWPKDLEIPLPR